MKLFSILGPSSNVKYYAMINSCGMDHLLSSLVLEIASLLNNMLYLSIGVFALYPCNNTVNREDVLTKFEINAYADDKEYQPIVLYIPKTCDVTSPEGT